MIHEASNDDLQGDALRCIDADPQCDLVEIGNDLLAGGRMNPRDQGPALLLAPGRNRSSQLSLAASPNPRQNRARLGASEDSLEELILSLPLDETCGDCGTTAEANSRGRSGWVACGHATNLPDVLSRRPQRLVSLRVPQGWPWRLSYKRTTTPEQDSCGVGTRR